MVDISDILWEEQVQQSVFLIEKKKNKFKTEMYCFLDPNQDIKNGM